MTVNANKNPHKNALALRRGGNANVLSEPETKGLKNDKAGSNKKRPVGLVNLGNTCFMNAALQCLCRTPGLLSKLELLASNPVATFTGSSIVYNENDEVNNELKLKLEIPSDSMVRKMVHLLERMTEGGTGGAVNPRAVHCVMARNFGAGLQHDSHELLRHVLDKLKKDQIRAFRLALMDLFDIPREEASKMHQNNPKKALEIKEWDRKLYHSTVVDDLFGGKLVTTRTCLECKSIKTSYEEFLDLSLPIRVVKCNNENSSSTVNNRFSLLNEVTTINRTLYECLKCFAEPETLSGNNNVDCEKCHEIKLNQVKAGKLIEEVFPQPPPPVVKVNPKSKATTSKKFLKSKKNVLVTADNVDENLEESKPQKQRKRRKKKTRKEKIEGDAAGESNEGAKSKGDNDDPGNGSSNSEPEIPDLEKVADEGYAEDYKETDDSSGASVGARSSGADNDPDQEDDGEEAEDEEESNDPPNDENRESEDEKPIPQPVIPKSTKSPCSRQTMISRPPQNLTIHLKRFTVSTKGFTCKLADHVKFEEYIDIRDYVKTELPQYDDDDGGDSCETGPMSPGSWSFEELGSKDPDVLGGGSGDTRGCHSSDAFILPLPGYSHDSEPVKSLESHEDSTSLQWKNPSTSFFDEQPVQDKAVGDSVVPSTVEEAFVAADKTVESTVPEEAVQDFSKLNVGPPKYYGPALEPESIDQICEPSTSSEYHCYYELDSSPEKLDTVSHRLQPILDLSPISRTVSEEVPDTDYQKVVQFSDNVSLGMDAVDPLAEENVIDSYPGVPDEYDDEPPPYPGSPPLLDDEDDGISNTIDLNLPQPANDWMGYKSPSEIERWSAGKDDYKPEDEPTFDPFEDMDSMKIKNSLSDDESSLFTPTAPQNNLGIPGTSRLPSYQEITGTIDSPAANIWGQTILSAKVETKECPPAYDTIDSKAIPLPSPSLSYQPDEEKSSYFSNTGNGFDNNFTPMPPPVIALGYHPDPISINDTPTVIESFENQDHTRNHVPDLPSETKNADDVGCDDNYTDLEQENAEEARRCVTDPNGINYRLYGIVEHGGSLNWGHYVAYIRVGSSWYYISDSCVSNSDISTVLSRDPYILFYERIV